MSKYKVITDPCYILPEDIWNECIEKCEQYKDANWSERFNEAVKKALTEFSGSNAWVERTGFGDWTNEVYGPAVVDPYFAADSGMVCVCDYSEPVKASLENISDGCAAMIETSGDITVEFDRSISDWTVVYITDLVDDCEWHTHIPSDDEDDE